MLILVLKCKDFLLCCCLDKKSYLIWLFYLFFFSFTISKVADQTIRRWIMKINRYFHVQFSSWPLMWPVKHQKRVHHNCVIKCSEPKYNQFILTFWKLQLSYFSHFMLYNDWNDKPISSLTYLFSGDLLILSAGLQSAVAVFDDSFTWFVICKYEEHWCRTEGSRLPLRHGEPWLAVTVSVTRVIKGNLQSPATTGH